jgi:cytochrome P450
MRRAACRSTSASGVITVRKYDKNFLYNANNTDCFDVVSKITMGQALGFMEEDGHDAHGLIKRVTAFGSYVNIVSQMPWLHKVFQDNPIMRRSKPSPFMGAVRTTVQNRLAKPDPDDQPRPDLLSHFVATHGQDPTLMDQKQVLISTSGNMIAGGLSPSKAFDTLCQYLCTHPDSQDKLYEEIKQARINLPASYDEIKSLPYLEGIIKEAYRLHSSASFSLRRVTGPEGFELPNGVHLPPNVDVGCPMGAVNQDPVIFGDDADTYRPERWMQPAHEDDAAYIERRKTMEKTELTFGLGSRSCVGKNIAFLEFFKVVATLLAQFKVCKRQVVALT